MQKAAGPASATRGWVPRRRRGVLRAAGGQRYTWCANKKHNSGRLFVARRSCEQQDCWRIQWFLRWEHQCYSRVPSAGLWAGGPGTFPDPMRPQAWAVTHRAPV